MTMTRYHQQINVRFSYDVIFTRALFALDNETVTEAVGERDGGTKAIVFIDRNVAAGHPDLPEKIKDWCAAHPRVWNLVSAPVLVPGGEEVKNDLLFVQKTTHVFQRYELCRHSYVVAIGGGAVLDAVGLAAAVFHRGLRLVRIPTTVLSQNDSGVGVKNAVNLDGAKNQIGTFAPPWAVFNDALFLATLDQRDWRGGLAEAFKVAVIKDAAFLAELEGAAERLVARDLDAMEQVVRRCAILHLEHIRTNGDPFEFGSAKPLDFGHWSAHKLESMSDYKLRHGEAVAIGIALDLFCAAKLGLLSAAERDRVCTAMERCGLVLRHPALNRRSSTTGALVLLDGLEEFRQHLGGELTLTFPDGLGRRKEINKLPAALVEEAVQWLSSRNSTIAEQVGLRSGNTGNKKNRLPSPLPRRFPPVAPPRPR